MSDHVVRCAICQDPADQRSAIRGVAGWEHRRSGGGAHGITLKEVRDAWAHPACVVAAGEELRRRNARNVDPRARRRPIEPVRVGQPCWYAGLGCDLGPVDAHSADQWKRVHGFDPPRSGGGRNGVPVRTVVAGAAHEQCILRLAAKVAPGQGTLL